MHGDGEENPGSVHLCPHLEAELQERGAFEEATQELLARGYSSGDLHKVLGHNLIRAFREAGAVADKSRWLAYPSNLRYDAQ